MPVTVQTGGAPTPWTPIAPAVELSPGVFGIDNTQPVNSGVARCTLPAAAGLASQFVVTAVNPGGPDSTIRIDWTDRAPDGAILTGGSGPDHTITGTEQDLTLAMPPSVPGTGFRVVALLNRDTPLGDPNRINLEPDPRCTTAGRFSSAANWGAPAAFVGGNPLPGLTSYVAAACTTANSGIGILYAYQPPTATNPVAGVGVPVVAGSTVSLSCYVFATKASDRRMTVRCFAGTTWSAAGVVSTTTHVPAGTWTRLTWTGVIPAGATHLVFSVQSAANVSWAVGDRVGISAILVEEAAAADVYFDGDMLNGLVGSVAWETDPNNSPSLYWTSTLVGRRVALIEENLTLAADAEELVGVQLERDYRRSVADIWGAEQALITAGTAALLSGQLVFLCETLAQALTIDTVYRRPGLTTLTTGGDLDGLTHRAIGRARLTPDQILPGKPARWLVTVEFREQTS